MALAAAAPLIPMLPRPTKSPAELVSAVVEREWETPQLHSFVIKETGVTDDGAIFYSGQSWQQMISPRDAARRAAELVIKKPGSDVSFGLALPPLVISSRWAVEDKS